VAKQLSNMREKLKLLSARAMWQEYPLNGKPC
jgi:hypothetical protein